MRLNGAARPVWEAKERHPGGVTALAAGRAANGGPLLAWGGRDGAVRLCSADRGTLLQTLDTAQYSRGKRPREIVRGLVLSEMAGLYFGVWGSAVYP